MNHNKFSLFTFVTIAVLLFQLVSPALVYAEGETPPPTLETPTETSLPPTEITPAETEAPLVTESPTLETPTETSLPPTEVTPTETEAPPITESPTLETPTETSLPPTEVTPTETEAPPVTESPTLETPTETSLPPTETETPVLTETPTLEIPTETALPPTETATDTPTLTPSPTETPSETPSPTPSVAETPTPTAEPDSDNETETPIPTELPTEEPTPAPTEPPSTPAPDVVTASEESVVSQTPLLQSLKSDTADVKVVVLNANGKPEPLVTKKAAQAVAQNGPMWCKTKTSCQQYASVDALKSALNGVKGSVTIYFPTEYNGADAIFDGNDENLAGLKNLTIQGGWNGTVPVEGTPVVTGKTKFDSLVAVVNWKGKVTVNNVNAANGFVVNTKGAVEVKDSDFTSKDKENGVGLLVESGGTVDIKNSTFTETGTGLLVESGSDVTIKDSDFTGNMTGAHITTTDDTITVTGGTVSENGTGIVTRNCQKFVSNTTYSGNVQDYDDGCKTSSITTPEPTTTPAVISTLGEGLSNLSCAGQDGFLAMLPNKDMIQIFCPVSGSVDIRRLDSTMLPADLPAGYGYVSAFSVQIIQNKLPIQVITEGGYIKASFVTNTEQVGAHFGILYWDGSQWTELKEYMLDEHNASLSFDLYPDDSVLPHRRIISGVQLETKSDIARSAVVVNFPGAFVLVQY